MPAPITAIVNATVVTLDGPDVLPGWTVLTRGDEIIDARSTETLPPPDDARIVDAKGKFLTPGFVDMHIHTGFPALQAPDSPNFDRLVDECAVDGALYLANGVTMTRNMSGAPFHLQMKRDIDAGRLLWPRLRTTSPILDGAPPVWPFSPIVQNRAQAEAIVGEIADAGYEAIKVYNHLSTDAYAALVDAGRRAKLPVVGHVPFSVGITGALEARQHSIEHFRGYDFDPGYAPGLSAAPDRFRTWLTLTDEQLRAYAKKTRAAGTWNCPTLVVLDSGAEIADRGVDAMPPSSRYLPRGLRESMIAGIRNPVFSPDVLRVLAAGKPRQFALLKMMHEDGGRLLVGTDASVLTVLPGFSLHDELANFVAAGLTPLEALICCCRNPGVFYDSPLIGRIRAGAPADLVLLDGNPLQDIANTRRIAGVMTRGRWLPRQTLDDMLVAASLNAPHPYPLPAGGERGSGSNVVIDRKLRIAAGQSNRTNRGE